MTYRTTAAQALIAVGALTVLAACGRLELERIQFRQHRGRAGARRQPGHRPHRRLAVDEQHHGVRQRVDLDLRADHAAAVHGDAERQGRHAVAGHQLHRLAGQEDLHVHPAQGREVLQRQADDVGRREVLHRPGERGGQGLGLHQHGDQVGLRAVGGHRGGPPQVPVGAAARRPVAVLQRDRPGQLRRPDREPVLPAPGRHRPVQVGLLAQGLGAQAGPQPVLLAEGQALPGQRHLDRRAQRQHQGTPAQGRAGAGGRVPGLVHGGQPEGHLGRHDEPVQLDQDRLPGLQRDGQAVPGRARAPGHLVRDQPGRAGQGRAVRQRQPANSLFPPQVPYYQPATKGLQYNLAAAKAEMAKSSVPHGFTTTILVSSGFSDYAHHRHDPAVGAEAARHQPEDPDAGPEHGQPRTCRTSSTT